MFELNHKLVHFCFVLSLNNLESNIVIEYQLAKAKAKEPSHRPSAPAATFCNLLVFTIYGKKMPLHSSIGVAIAAQKPAEMAFTEGLKALTMADEEHQKQILGSWA